MKVSAEEAVPFEERGGDRGGERFSRTVRGSTAAIKLYKGKSPESTDHVDLLGEMGLLLGALSEGGLLEAMLTKG